MKVRAAFSNLTWFIGWEVLCDCRLEAKVPHLFHHWQMRASTRYEYFWVWKLFAWNLPTPGSLPALLSSHTAMASGDCRHMSTSWHHRRTHRHCQSGSKVCLCYFPTVWSQLAGVTFQWLQNEAAGTPDVSSSVWVSRILEANAEGKPQLALWFISGQVHSVLWEKRPSSF